MGGTEKMTVANVTKLKKVLATVEAQLEAGYRNMIADLLLSTRHPVGKASALANCKKRLHEIVPLEHLMKELKSRLEQAKPEQN
jgi:hypothetical protein